MAGAPPVALADGVRIAGLMDEIFAAARGGEDAVQEAVA